MTAAWSGQPQWRVLETAFGSGRRFLATWRAWKDDPQRPAMLHVAAIAAAVPTAGELRSLHPELAAQWSAPEPGFHRFVLEHGRVLLTLCIGDLQATLRELDFTADAVVIDGELPLHALKAVARLCRRGTQLSQAPANAQDLAQCGFVAGVGGDLLFAPAWEPKGLRHGGATAGDCVVVGAGLAGAAAAACMAQRGWKVRVLDSAAQPAAGASGIPAGLAAPHHSPDDSLLSRLTRSGIRATLHEARALLREGQDWQLTGVQEHRPGSEPLWHAQAGWIKPAALVRAWLAQPGIAWQGSTQVARIARDGGNWRLLDGEGRELARASLVIVAAAHGSAALLGDALPLQPVRGQLSWGLRKPQQEFPAFPVKGGGHFLPLVPLEDGAAWLCGSSYQRDDTDTAPRAQDQADNLERLRAVLPDTARQLAPVFASGEARAWTGVRCVSADRRPLAGEIAPGLWTSTAMGSRGLSFAVLCAQLIAARLHEEPLPLPRKMASALGVERQIRLQAAPAVRE